jgi:hypothetical protein
MYSRAQDFQLPGSGFTFATGTGAGKSLPTYTNTSEMP